MDAIKLLKQQHRSVEQLFRQFESSDDDDEKRAIFGELADNLAVHATIEERHFYPAVRLDDTEDEVEEAYEEHLDVKKLILNAMAGIGSPGFDGKVAAIKGAVEHHVEEEEQELFPKVRQDLSSDALEAIGQQLEAATEELMAKGEPRKDIKPETEPPAISA
jgi:hemerythrin superfamily protein